MSQMIDWTQLSDDPNNSEAKRLVKRYLLAARQIHMNMDLTQYVLEAATGLRVLDVGVAAHAARYINDPGWRHARIHAVAARCVGVDILESLVKELRARGYDVRCVDATSQADLEERFDLVFIGDVIEHVDNPAALLRFAGRHLAPAGRLLVATPNPFSRKFYRRFRRDGLVMTNLDHVAWFSQTMALELGRRAGLVLHAYHLVKPIAPWKQPLKRLAWRYFAPEYTFPDFLFEYRVPQPDAA